MRTKTKSLRAKVFGPKMASVRTRRGDRGPHRRMFTVPKGIDETTMTGYPEKVENPGAESFVWSGSQYFDNGYGFYFDYDVDLPENPDQEVKLDGRTKAETDAERDRLIKKIGQGTVNAFYRLDPDSFEDEKKGDQAKVDKADPYALNDLMYLDAMLGLYDYWEATSPEDIKLDRRFKRYSTKTGNEAPLPLSEDEVEEQARMESDTEDVGDSNAGGMGEF
jgi:hypothetical protein